VPSRFIDVLVTMERIASDFRLIFQLGRDHLPNLLAFFSWGMLVPSASVVASLLVWAMDWPGRSRRIVDATSNGIAAERRPVEWRTRDAVAVAFSVSFSGMESWVAGKR